MSQHSDRKELTQKVSNLEVIFDNGGGITIQCDEYVHNYDDPTRAAEDAKQLIFGADPAAGWDGNEPDYRVNPTDEQLHNGGYRTMSADDLRDEMASPDLIDDGWYNVSHFLAALTGRTIAG